MKPQAYRRLPDVLMHHADTFTILHTFHHIDAAMAGKGLVDPYND